MSVFVKLKEKQKIQSTHYTVTKSYKKDKDFTDSNHNITTNTKKEVSIDIFKLNLTRITCYTDLKQLQDIFFTVVGRHEFPVFVSDSNIPITLLPTKHLLRSFSDQFDTPLK